MARSLAGLWPWVHGRVATRATEPPQLAPLASPRKPGRETLIQIHHSPSRSVSTFRGQTGSLPNRTSPKWCFALKLRGKLSRLGPGRMADRWHLLRLTLCGSTEACSQGELGRNASPCRRHVSKAGQPSKRDAMAGTRNKRPLAPGQELHLRVLSAKTSRCVTIIRGLARQGCASAAKAPTNTMGAPISSACPGVCGALLHATSMLALGLKNTAILQHRMSLLCQAQGPSARRHAEGPSVLYPGHLPCVITHSSQSFGKWLVSSAFPSTL